MKFADDAVDTASLDAHARSDRVDAVVVAFHGDLGALSRLAGHILYGDETVMNLGNFLLEETAQEPVVGTRDYHFGIAVGIVHPFHDGAHHVALAEKVAGYLFLFGKDQFVLFLVEKQHLPLPYLMHFAGDDLSLELLEFGGNGVFLEIKYLRLECLSEIENGPAAEFLEENLLCDFFADLAFRVDFTRSGEPYLTVGVLYLSVGNDYQVLIYLTVSLVGIHDYVEVVVGAELLCKHVAE